MIGSTDNIETYAPHKQSQLYTIICIYIRKHTFVYIYVQINKEKMMRLNNATKHIVPYVNNLDKVMQKGLSLNTPFLQRD